MKIACIGAGYFSRFHYDAWARIDGVEVVGAAALTLDEAAATGQRPFDDAGEMLRQCRPDIVDIITPPPTHRAFVAEAIACAPRAIICQKPFCRSLGEAMEVALLAEAAGIPLIVHENFRFQPWYRLMKRELDAGTLGDVHQMTFRLRTGDGQGPQAYLARQPYFQRMERFLIHETAIHWVDTFRFLFGDPQTVYADLRRMNPSIRGEDAGLLVLGYADGRRAVFDGNRHLDHDAESCRLTFGEALLEGTEAVLTLAGDGSVVRRRFGGRGTDTVLPAQDYAGFAGDCVHALQAHVVAALNGAAAFENTARAYLANLRIEDAIYRSAEEGRRITLVE